MTANQSRYFEKARYRLPQDRVIKAYVEPKLAYIRQVVPLGPSTSLIDIGCGNGVFTFYLSQLCGSVVGVDKSRSLLSENPYRTVIESDATALPFSAAAFDVAFEANLLHHVERPIDVVREMSRLSRDWVILIEPNRYNPLMLLFGLLVPAERGLLASTKPAITKLLNDCNLNCVLLTTTGMISQNNTPAFLLPLLKLFDREIWYGEYIIAVARIRRV
jgi:ubiquinone/menaquinone biosynthesis C-methylase UbiE